MQVDRRTLLGAAVALIGFTHASPAVAQGARVRRNIHSLSANDDNLNALAQALAIMRQRADFYSMEGQRALHAMFGQHQSWMFFPWHRIELLLFERVVAELTGLSTFALPYWDYQTSQYLPLYFNDEGSPFFHPGRAPAGTNYAQSRWQRQDAADLLFDPFDTFVGTPTAAGRAEALGHDLVHALVGGDMASLDTATLDPIFFVHHCNVDRVWLSWQSRLTGAQLPPAWMMQPIVMPPNTINGLSVGQVLNTADLGYTYDSLYPLRFFSVPDTPPVGVPSNARREDISERVYKLNRNGTHTEVLELPEELLSAYRADSDRLLRIEGSGTAGFATDGLAGHVIEVEGAAEQSRARPVEISASIPLLPKGAHASHGPGIAAHRFRFGDNLSNLIGRSSGPVHISTRATRLQRGNAVSASSLVPAVFEAEVKLVTTRWV